MWGLDLEQGDAQESKCLWILVLQKDTEDKLEGYGEKWGGPKSNANEVTFHVRYDKEEMKYAGHVMRGSSGLSHLQILEGRLEGKQKVGRPKR